MYSFSARTHITTFSIGTRIYLHIYFALFLLCTFSSFFDYLTYEYKCICMNMTILWDFDIREQCTAVLSPAPIPVPRFNLLFISPLRLSEFNGRRAKQNKKQIELRLWFTVRQISRKMKRSVHRLKDNITWDHWRPHCCHSSGKN